MHWFWKIILILIFVGFLYLLWKLFLHIAKRLYYKRKVKDLKYLFVKISRKSETETDQRMDVIQNMKQNIEVMNQIYKNIFSLTATTWVKRLIWQDYLTFEIIVEKEVIKFIIGIPEEFVESFEKTISSFYPGSVVDEIKQPKFLDEGKYAYGGYFFMQRDNPFPLKTYETMEWDPMDSLLGSFSRVKEDEILGLQLLISPLSEKKQNGLRKHIERIKKGGAVSGFFSFIGNILSGGENISKDKENKKFSSQQMQDMEKKVEGECFSVIIRALAVSPKFSRAKNLIHDLEKAFNQYNYIGLNRFVLVEANKIKTFTKAFVTRLCNRPFFTFRHFLFLIRSQVINIKEASSIFHLPHKRFNQNPRIKWQNFKIVPAPDNLSKTGIILGNNLYSGVKKEVKVSIKDRFRHFYVIGQTGTGKSTMLLVQAKQDLLKGNGFCIIDPHGDLCEKILEYYPKDRIDDLIYFDAGNTEMPIGFNVFEAQGSEEMDIVLNDLVEMFIQMYGPEIFGPRIQDYFRNAAWTLMEQPEGGTLTEIVRIFTDNSFQKLKLRNVKNPVIRTWWEKTFNAMGDREKAESIPYFQAKFSPFTSTPIIRNIIGQPKSSFDLGDAMNTNKVILLNLSKGKMGELNSKLLGSMMVTQIKLSALRRANMPEEQRTPFFLYIDEFQNYINPSIETILSEARKYRLGLVIAHQYIEQLVHKGLGGETDLRPAIFGNVGTIMSYKVGAKDAEYLEQEFVPEFDRADMVNMDKFKGVMKLSVDTQPSRPFSLSVPNPFEEKPYNNEEKVNILKEISSLKWGRKKELVEKDIYYRVGV